MTIQQMAQAAIDVQGACNLSGIVRSFHDITLAMRNEHSMSTPECNSHPVSIAFAHKIADLTGAFISQDATAAFTECERLARRTEHGIRG